VELTEIKENNNTIDASSLRSPQVQKPIITMFGRVNKIGPNYTKFDITPFKKVFN
jgi:hypothetical protein